MRWSHQGFPACTLNLAHEQHFNAAPRRVALAYQSCRKDPCVVNYDNVTGVNVFRKKVKSGIFASLVGAIQDQHAGIVTLFQGLLRDQLFGKLIVKIREKHLKERAAIGWESDNVDVPGE